MGRRIFSAAVSYTALAAPTGSSREVATMPYAFEFDSGSRILRGRLDGRVTDADLKNYCRDFTSRISLSEPLAGITDLAEVSSFEVSRQTILDLAALQPVIVGHEPLRIIIATAPHVFGVARMFELEGRSAHPNVHVVHTRQEAYGILGVAEPQFEPCAK